MNLSSPNSPDTWEEEIDAVEIESFLDGLVNSTEGPEAPLTQNP